MHVIISMAAKNYTSLPSSKEMNNLSELEDTW